MKTISKAFKYSTLALVASAAVLTSTVPSIACQYSVRTSDQALMDSFPIPTFSTAKKFVVRQAVDFDIAESSWTGHGFEAFDDPHYEYSKHWLSSYLISAGTYFESAGKDSNGNPLQFDRAFHSAHDYYTMAKGEPDGLLFNVSHSRFVSLLGDWDPLKLGEYEYSKHPPVSAALFWPLAAFPEETETVTTFCGLFDVNKRSGPPPSVFLPDTENVFGTPGERASDLVHEGMHAHYKEVEALGHVTCATGAPSSTGSCDHFYPHPKGDYKGGDLGTANGSSRKIPAYELQYEYLCDLLDEANDWVPLVVLSDAVGAKDRTATLHFVDSKGRPTPPPFVCGVPSPMMTQPGALCGISTCTKDADCNSDNKESCENGCCTVLK